MKWGIERKRKSGTWELSAVLWDDEDEAFRNLDLCYPGETEKPAAKQMARVVPVRKSPPADSGASR